MRASGWGSQIVKIRLKVANNDEELFVGMHHALVTVPTIVFHDEHADDEKGPEVGWMHG